MTCSHDDFSVLDVGCGYLPDHKRRGGIGIDLQRGTCDIIADIRFAPFRDHVFKKIFARNVIEHIDLPLYPVLKELKRLLASNGKISITIPIHPNPCVDELIKFTLGFPLRIFQTIKRLIRWRKHRDIRGFWHANRVQPKHITDFFTVLKIFPISEKHPISVGRKSKILNKLGLQTIYYMTPDVWHILCAARAEEREIEEPSVKEN